MTHRIVCRALSAGVLGLLCYSPIAQEQYASPRKMDWPASSANGVLLHDVNNDGLVDAILARSGQNELHLGVGKASFTDATANLPAISVTSFAVAAGDVDGDGDPDLLFGNFGQNRLYLNDGNGVFTDVTATHMPVDADRTEDIIVADVDDDDDLDVFCANWQMTGTQPSRLYLNNGSGQFTDVSATHLPANNEVLLDAEFADIDGDNDFDLVLVAGFALDLIFANDGNGVFTDETAALLPQSSFNTNALAIGDIDGDGDLDTAWGGGTAGFVYLNDGHGLQTRVPGFQIAGPVDPDSALEFVDVDGDTDLDLVVGFDRNGQLIEVYINDGAGNLTLAPGRVPSGAEWVDHLALADLNGNGAPDLVTVSFNRSRLFENDGTGTFTELPRSNPDGPFREAEQESYSRAVALADVDGDGDLDAAFGFSDFPGKQNRLYLNDGRGGYTDATASALPAVLDPTTGLAFGDVNGDGAPDLVVANSIQGRLLLNNGTGQFFDIGLPPDTGGATAVTIGNFDGDSDLDLAFAVLGQNRIYRNEGNGIFTETTATHLPSDNLSSRNVVFFDADGDGDLDLFFGNGRTVQFPFGSAGQQNSLYLNDGSGNFVDVTATHLPAVLEFTSSVAVGDLDNDGDPDLVCGNGSGFCGKTGCPGGQDRVYLNNGLGVFTDATVGRVPPINDDTLGIALDDVDGDGDLDMISTPRRLYVNDGTGVFEDASVRIPPGMRGSAGIALGDIDDDGDADVIYRSPDNVFVNLQRHTRAPRLPRIGAPHVVDFTSQPGIATEAQTAFLVLAGAPARIPIPGLGVVGLNPAAIAILPPVNVPAPAGIASSATPVPNVASLIGAQIFGQTVLVGGSGMRLTNTMDDTIR